MCVLVKGLCKRVLQVERNGRVLSLAMAFKEVVRIVCVHAP